MFVILSKNYLELFFVLNVLFPAFAGNFQQDINYYMEINIPYIILANSDTSD